MKKQPAIIALIITVVGLAVTAPDSRAAGPTDNIPGLSQIQKARQAAYLQSVRSSGSRAAEGHAKHYHAQKTGR